MRDVDRGNPERLLDASDFDAHLLTQQRIEVGQWLVKQQHLRPHHQAARQRDALLLPAREAPRRPFGECFQADEVERLHDAGFDLWLGDLAHAQAIGDVVEHVEVREEAVGLEDGRRGALVGRQEGDIHAADADLATGGQFEAADHAQHRRLAAARRPEQGHQFTTADLQLCFAHGMHIGLGLRVPEGLGHFLERHRNG